MKRIIAVFIVLISVLSLTACGNKMTDEEIAEAAKPLIEASFKINEIFFGSGLPLDMERSEFYEIDVNADTDMKNTYYIPVSYDCEFQYISEIKEAASAVYSTDYCENNLFTTAFVGIVANGEIAEYARFYENEYGELTQRYDTADDKPLTVREYDYSSVKSVKQTDTYVIFSVDTYVNGEQSDTIRITMKKEAAGWRLDTPTY